MYRLLFVSFLVSGCVAQLQINNTCSASNLTGIQVNITQLVGKWYQIERIVNTDELGDCSTSTFTNENSRVTVLNREVFNRTERTRTGVVTRNSADLTGKFEVTFGTDQYDYYALVSDYVTYALLLACRDTSNSTSNVWAWKLSRTNTMSNASALTVNGVVAQHPLLTGRPFMVTKHSDDACNGSKNLIGPSVLALVASLILSRFNMQ